MIELQISCDTGDYEKTIQVLDQVYPYVDIIEVGKLWWYHGIGIVKEIRERYPDRKYMVDTKMLGPMYRDIEDMKYAYDSGADIVTVSALMPYEEHVMAVNEAKKDHCLLGEDFSDVTDLSKELMKTDRAGADIAFIGNTEEEIQTVRKTHLKAACGGGVSTDNIEKLAALKPDVIYTGRGIFEAEDPVMAAGYMQEICRKYGYEIH